MSIKHLAKVAATVCALTLSNMGCAVETAKTKPAPTKPPEATETTTPMPAHGFKTNQDGKLIPINKDGKEFVSCGTAEKNTCAIFNKDVTIKEFKNTVITKMVYKVNPTCIIYIIDFGDGSPPLYYTDPSDPNCPKFN
jgi:hypothetical protein